jgi:hypothetical protein
MSDLRNRRPSMLARVGALALGLLLVPISLTPQGLDENLACGTEGPDGDCVIAPGLVCLLDGEFVQHRRAVE